jgi:uroporphyrinogen-III synthase
MRVLVTRPEPGASRTASRLEARGHAAIRLPLSRIVPVAADPPPDPSGLSAVAASSANAVRHASPALLAALGSVTCHVVGEATAQEARSAGLPVGRVEAGAAALARELGRMYSPGSRIAYLCGRIRLGDFEALAHAAGLRVAVIETYDTPRTDLRMAEVMALLRGLPVDAVLLYSAAAAEAFAALGEDATIAASFGRARFLCLSRRIAAALPPTLQDRVRVARRPDEDALFALLDAS